MDCISHPKGTQQGHGGGVELTCGGIFAALQTTHCTLVSIELCLFDLNLLRDEFFSLTNHGQVIGRNANAILLLAPVKIIELLMEFLLVTMVEHLKRYNSSHIYSPLA